MEIIVKWIADLLANLGSRSKKPSLMNDAYLDFYPDSIEVHVEEKKKPVILFKEGEITRLQREFDQLSSRNKDLLEIAVDIAYYCVQNKYPDLVITMIFREEEEQDRIYRNNARYQQKKFKSPHQFWHALDIRSRTFTIEQIDKLVNYLNLKYNSSNHYRWTAKCHNVGLGDHFHIQYVRK